MQLRALWCSLIAAAAVALILGGPVQAQTSAATTQASTGKPLALGKYTKQRSRHARKAATRSSRHANKKTAKTSSKSSERSRKTKNTADNARDNKAKDNETKDRAKTASVRKAAEELSAVADARAELKTDDQPAPLPSFNNFTATAADDFNATGPDGSAPHTLSDLDKAAMAASTLDTTVATPAAASPVKMVSAAPEPAPPISGQVASSHDDIGDTWDRTSLIGKIFVAFGGLLTLASAARMFMA
jgi:hypothetical protein